MSNQLKSFSNRIRTTTISEKEYQIYLLPAGEGIKMAKELSSLILPVLGALTSGTGEGEDVSIDFKSIATELITNMEDFDILITIKRLLKDVAVDGQDIEFDTHYMGNYGELIEAVSYALTENFSSFFSQSGIFKNLV